MLLLMGRLWCDRRARDRKHTARPGDGPETVWAAWTWSHLN